MKAKTDRVELLVIALSERSPESVFSIDRFETFASEEGRFLKHYCVYGKAQGGKRKAIAEGNYFSVIEALQRLLEGD